MRIKSSPLIRFLAGPMFVFMFIIIPLIGFIFFLLQNWPIQEKIPLLAFPGVFLIGGIALFHFDFWERCYAYIVITPESIIRKCAFRKSIIISRKECKSIGLEMESTPIPNEYPYIYFTSLSYPLLNNHKPGTIKSKAGLIKFRYSNHLAEYVMKEFPRLTTYALCSYYRQKKRR